VSSDGRVPCYNKGAELIRSAPFLPCHVQGKNPKATECLCKNIKATRSTGVLQQSHHLQYIPQAPDFPPLLQGFLRAVSSFDVPDGVLAGINYSLDHEGCLLHTMLRAKPSTGNNKTSSLRLQLRKGQTSGPGGATVLHESLSERAHQIRLIRNYGNRAAMTNVTC